MPFRYRAAFQYVMINDFLSISSAACADKETMQHLRSYHFKQLTRIIRAAQSITWSALDFDCLNYTYAPRISQYPGKQAYMPSVKYAYNGAPELRASLIASCPMWVLCLQRRGREPFQGQWYCTTASSAQTRRFWRVLALCLIFRNLVNPEYFN